MKTLAFLATIFFAGRLALAISGPATVLLENTPLVVGNTGARFADDQGRFLSGSDYRAQLYIGTNSNHLTKAGTPVEFLTGDMTGYFRGGTIEVPFIQGGTMAWVQVRAWESAGGTTFEEAALAGRWTGISSVLYVMTGNPNSPGVPTIPAPLRDLIYPGPPVIVREPKGKTVRAGQDAELDIVASGGVRLSYQWHEGESGNTAKPIKNATNLVYIASPSATSMYWVRAYTSVGSTNSATATLTVIATNAVSLDLRVDGRVPVLTVDTPATGQLHVQFTGSVNSPNWDTLTNISLTTNRLTIVDAGGSNALVRFYRGVILP